MFSKRTQLYPILLQLIFLLFIQIFIECRGQIVNKQNASLSQFSLFILTQIVFRNKRLR